MRVNAHQHACTPFSLIFTRNSFLNTSSSSIFLLSSLDDPKNQPPSVLFFYNTSFVDVLTCVHGNHTSPSSSCNVVTLLVSLLLLNWRISFSSTPWRNFCSLVRRSFSNSATFCCSYLHHAHQGMHSTQNESACTPAAQPSSG